MSKRHQYEVNIKWSGNDGEGTGSYHGYRRAHVIAASNKADIVGSSDPAFRGDPQHWNPEELFVASLSACHMLWYLHLCAAHQVVAIAYADSANGVMEEDETGSGRFIYVELRPRVTISRSRDIVFAGKLHIEAHENCFIANSVNFPVQVSPSVFVAKS